MSRRCFNRDDAGREWRRSLVERDDSEDARTLPAEDGHGKYVFRTASEADSARHAIRTKPEGATCPRIISCSCGGAGYQKVWGLATYCWKCGGLM